MQVRVLGSNGTYPTPGRPASGYIVTTRDATVWVDAGPGTFAAALGAGVVSSLDAIVLSHRHGDHCLDVLPLLNYLRFGLDRMPPIPLFAPDGVVDRLAAFAGAGPEHDFFRVFAPSVISPGDGVDVAGARLLFGDAVHPVPAVSVSLGADGARVVYSGDTGPGSNLEAFARECEVLVCEATWQGSPGPNRYPFHLHASEAGELAQAAGVGRLVLTHLSPTLDPERSIAEAAATYSGPVSHAAAGTIIDV